MLIVLGEEHKEHLSFLNDVDADVVREFCKIAVEFLRKGVNPKLYHSATQKLGVSAETVKHGIEGLMYLMTECAKLMISELDFKDSVMVLGFSEDLNDEMLRLYLEHRKEIRAILSEMSMDLPHYHNLEWRLDVQLASRSLRRQTDPSIVMRLHTKDRGKSDVQVLQADPANLLHMANVLEEALGEMKTAHCRRILRNIKT
ncbi:COMM domain-containing protein 2-like [Oscarella lobularis]|uniref:COMM domain-containing protein 2-like n=1 Tax=Oscarella lobularis TaxID=121494 RepID=UPI003313ACF6